MKLCSSKRPISLICALVKALEILVLNRLIHTREPAPDCRQYAHRRARSTELHPVKLNHYARRAIARREFVYVASADVDGAFDAVSHKSFIRTFGNAKVGDHMCPYPHTRLARRAFKIRRLSHNGRTYSDSRRIWRGLLQGGVLPRVMWLVNIKPLFQNMQRIRGIGITNTYTGSTGPLK